MISYAQKITKDEMAALPLEEYTGRVILVDNEKDVPSAIAFLSQRSCVGFDTETRPSFHKGQRHKIALMQISTENVCFLFRLNKIGVPKLLEDFLANPNILKIGLSLRDDFGAIRKRTPVELVKFLDLQNYVGSFGITEASLQKIYAIIFNKKISKGQRLTNWEAGELTDMQKKYAALDAWACLVIYNRLNNPDINE
jgi:ribonuclease D